MKPNHLIRLSKSCIGEAEKKAVEGVLDREYLGMGAEVQQLEQALTTFFGRQAVCVVNGTAALQLALQACDIKPGDEVLVPSLTYVASYQAISAVGAVPVACDIDPASWLLDWHDAAKRFTPKTKAIMPVHYSGGVGELNELYHFANEKNIRVIEDAAHAFGSTYLGKRIGSFGDIACFSFDGIKNITSGEGGCIVTDDEKILQRMRDARLLGVEKDTEKRYSGQRSWEFDVTAQGWRFHMSNIMAAIGLVQLNRFTEFATIRQERAKLYDKLFEGQSFIVPLKRDYDVVVPHVYVVRIPGLKSRNELQTAMLHQNIQTGFHYMPNHLLTMYSDPSALPLHVTEALYPEILTLPLHPEVSEAHVAFVVEVLKKEIQRLI